MISQNEIARNKFSENFREQLQQLSNVLLLLVRLIEDMGLGSESGIRLKPCLPFLIENHQHSTVYCDGCASRILTQMAMRDDKYRWRRRYF